MSGTTKTPDLPRRVRQRRQRAAPLPASGDVQRSFNRPAAPPSSGVTGTIVSGDRAESGSDLPHSFMLLIELANFGLLRRHLGIRRADELASDAANRVATAVRDATIRAVGRNLIEVAFAHERGDAATTAIARIRSAFSLPIDIDGEQHVLRLTIGGASAARLSHDSVRLVELAESALNQARGEENDVVRDLASVHAAFDPLALMRDLPRAITNGEMFLQYQPKVHVRRQEVTSAEALVRWRHPERGLILPGDFIALAEQCGQIGQLTLWTLREVVIQQKALAKAGYDMPIFVNISGVLLGDRDFVRQALVLVRESGAKIGFEITETAVIRDPETAIAHLKLFAADGIPIAIDDYGAGLSSLAYLKQLPATELKIDKLFVTQLTSSNRDPLIVRSTIDLAHAMEMEVTAEGVETPAAMALLSVMGCDMIQGYLISRPLEIAAFREFLASNRHLEAVAKPRPSFNRNEGFWKSA